MSVTRLGIDAVGLQAGGGREVALNVLKEASRVGAGCLITVYASDPAILQVADRLPNLVGAPRRPQGWGYRAYWWLRAARRAGSRDGCRAMLHLANVALSEDASMISGVLIHQLNAFAPPVDARPLERTRLWLLRQLIAASTRRADRVFVQSPLIAQLVNEVADRDVAAVVAPPTPPSSLRAPEAGPRMAPQPPLFAYVGTDRPHKNIDVLVRAAPLLDAQLPGAVIALTCDANATAPGGPTYLGHLDREGIAELIAGSTALVMPSLSETVGLPMLEAMHLGVPVIAADLPYARALCGEAACYFDPRDASSLAAACVRVAQDPLFARSLVEKGFGTVARLVAEGGEAAMASWLVGSGREQQPRAPKWSRADD